MPTLEETLSDISTEVSQTAADVAAIGVATETKAGLLKVSGNSNPDNDSVPTVQFFKDRNIIGASGEAAGGLPQAQLDQIAALPTEAALAALAALPVAQISALPAEQVLTALSALPASLSGLEGRIIAVNSAGNGYEVVVAPSGGGGDPIPVDIVVDHFTGDGSTTAFTLSQSPANSNALEISVGGMSIDPAIYNVSGTTLTFNDAPPVTDTNAIVVRHLGTVAAVADGSIVTIKIANGAITLPKMANGTPGKFLKYNDSTGVIEEGDPVVGTVGDNSITTQKIVNKNVTLAKLADGTPGKIIGFNSSTGVAEEQSIIVPDNSIVTNKLFNKAVTIGKMADGTPGKILKYNNSTGVIEEADIATGTALVLLQEQTANNSASITFGSTHITSAYKKYIIDLIDVNTVADGGYMQFVISEDNGASYKGGSDYHSGGMSINTSGTTITGYAQANVAKVDINHQGIGNATGESLNATITMFNPAGTTKHKNFIMEITNQNSSGDTCRYTANASYKGTVNAINNIKIYPSAGNILSGTFKLYGVL